jgi:hypothetical protein
MKLTRWPPIFWLCISVSSLLVLQGAHGRWNPPVIVAAVVLAVAGLIIGLYLALRPDEERPRPRWFFWAIGGVALWYFIVAVAAGVFIDAWYAFVAFFAGVIPMTAVALWLATARSKTVYTEAGLRDQSVADNEDPNPGMGIDDVVEPGQHPEQVNPLEEDQTEGASDSRGRTQEERDERFQRRTGDQREQPVERRSGTRRS